MVSGLEGFRRRSARWWGVLGLLMLLPTGVVAQNVGRIAGVVTDAATGDPLPGVNVTIEGTTLGAASDIDGQYYILNVPPGRYTVRASMIGYQPVVVENVVVHADRTTELNFALQEATVEIGEIVVQAVRPDVERDKTSTSQIVRFDEVQAIPGIRNIGDVLTLAASAHAMGMHSPAWYASP